MHDDLPPLPDHSAPTYWPEPLTPGGFLSAGADVDAALTSGLARMWVVVWATYHHRTFLQAMYDRSYDNTRDRNDNSAEMAVLAPVTALQALDTDARLSQQLGKYRWETIRDAREAGATWSDVAAASGLSEQTARAEYERAIAEREQLLPGPPKPGGPIPDEWHNAERARAVLDDPPAPQTGSEQQ